MKVRALLPVVILLAAALGAGAWWWTQRAAPASGGAIVLHGNVDIRQVDLAFNSAGRVTQMLAREGERVDKGQLLATLDTQRLRQVEAQAAAQVAAQGEVVARLEAGSRPEEIARARADAEAARVDAANAERSYARAIWPPSISLLNSRPTTRAPRPKRRPRASRARARRCGWWCSARARRTSRPRAARWRRTRPRSRSCGAIWRRASCTRPRRA